MIRPKRKAAPTVFIDNGIVPDDASYEDKSLSNEDELLKETYSDVSGEDSNTDEDVEEIPVKISAKVSTKKTVKTPIKKEVIKPTEKVKNSSTTKASPTVKKPTKTNNTNDVTEDTEKPAKNIKSTRKFKLLPETIVAQGTTLKVNVKLIKKLEYETSTPIQCARQIAPIIYAAKVTSGKSTASTFRYIFTVQEVTATVWNETLPSNPKSFSYICESIINLDDEGKSTVKHIVKPQTKTTKKAENNAKNTDNVATIISSVQKEKNENLPIIEKKSVPTRINAKFLTPAKKKGTKK